MQRHGPEFNGWSRRPIHGHRWPQQFRRHEYASEHWWVADRRCGDDNWRQCCQHYERRFSNWRSRGNRWQLSNRCDICHGRCGTSWGHLNRRWYSQHGWAIEYSGQRQHGWAIGYRWKHEHGRQHGYWGEYQYREFFAKYRWNGHGWHCRRWR